MRSPALKVTFATLLAIAFLGLVASILFGPRRLPQPPEPGPGGAPPQVAGPRDPAGEGGTGVSGETPGERRSPLAIRGRVLDPQGAPAAAAEVTLWEVEEPDPFRLVPLFSDTWDVVRRARELRDENAKRLDGTKVDALGRFGFAAPPGGSYVLLARSPSGQTALSETLELASTEGIEVEVRILTGQEISGTVVDTEGQPAPAAEVSALLDTRDLLGRRTLPFAPRTIRMLMEIGELEQPKSAVTDNDGRFRLRGIGDGPYRLEARAAGKGSGSAPGVLGSERDVEIRLSPPPPRFRIEGSVALSAGKPAGGARVGLHEVRNGSVLEGRDIETAADDTGRFQLSDVPPGRYEIRTSGPGLQPRAHGPITVPEAVPTPLELLVEPGLVLSGKVVDGSEKPVGSLQVALKVFGRFPRRLLLETDAEGRFLADTLGPRDCLLTIPRQEPYSAYEALVQPGGEEITVPLEEFPCKVVIQGKVVDDESGQEIAGARVRLLSSAAGQACTSVLEATEPDGRFEFSCVEPVEASLQILSPGHVLLRTDPFALDPDDPPREVEIRLERAGHLEGTVQAPDGSPVKGARVSFGYVEFGDLVSQVGPDAIPAFTGADGSFRLSLALARPGGTHVVVVAHRDFQSEEAIEVQVDDPAATIAGLRIVLQPAARVRGTVLSEDGPLAGAEVELRRLLESAPGVQGAERYVAAAYSETTHRGTFEISTLSPGEYRLEVRCAGRSTHSGDLFTLRSGQEHSAEIVLEAEWTIAGKVLDSGGKPLDGVKIEARRKRGERGPRFSVRAWTRHDGAFRLGGLDLGVYDLRATKDDHATEVIERVEAGADEVEFVLYRFGSVRVIATDLQSGTPVEGPLRAELLPAHEKLRVHDAPTSTRKEPGQVLLEDVPPGPYRLRVLAEGYDEHTRSILVEPGQDTEIRVDLGPESDK